jgi:hypothetical protein
MKKLEGLLLRIITQKSNWAGLPLELAKRIFINAANEQGLPCSERDFSATLSRLLDSWKVDKAIAELSDEFAKKLGLSYGEPVWHLKVLTQEESEMFQNLDELDKAILRLLRKQNNPQHLGAIPIEEGRKILQEQGFSVEDASFHIEDYVREYSAFKNDESIWWIGLIWAHERTEEYQKIREKQMKEYDKKEARRLQMIEESECEDKREDKKNP